MPSCTYLPTRYMLNIQLDSFCFVTSKVAHRLLEPSRKGSLNDLSFHPLFLLSCPFSKQKTIKSIALKLPFIAVELPKVKEHILQLCHWIKGVESTKTADSQCKFAAPKMYCKL